MRDESERQEPENQFSLTRASLSKGVAQRANYVSTRSLRIIHVMYLLMGLLALSSTALAQIEPAAPGSIEYSLTTNNLTWFQTSDTITNGVYVEDLLIGRLNQPDGRGNIGIVTETAFDPDYNEMAATVDFGRNYSVGIVFSELSAVQIVPIPEPSTLLIFPLGILLWRAAMGRRPTAKATSG